MSSTSRAPSGASPDDGLFWATTTVARRARTAASVETRFMVLRFAFHPGKRPLPTPSSSGRIRRTSSTLRLLDLQERLRSTRQPGVGIGINNAQNVMRIAAALVILGLTTV